MDNEKVYRMKFSSVYPLLVNKAVRKGRTQEEVDEVKHIGHNLFAGRSEKSSV